MINLYHNNLSTCSQKVRLALEFKYVEWNSCHIDLMMGENRKPGFLSINPKGLVPVLDHDGNIITESSRINEYIDTNFDGIRLKPENLSDYKAMRFWVDYVDEVVHTSIGALTLSTVLRTVQLQRPREVVLEELNALPDGKIKDLKVDLFELGVESPYFKYTLRELTEFTKHLVNRLADRDWIAGDNVSLADISVIPYVLRIEHLGLESFFGGDEYVNSPVHSWVNRMKELPAYSMAIDKYITGEDIERISILSRPYKARIEELLNNQ